MNLLNKNDNMTDKEYYEMIDRVAKTLYETFNEGYIVTDYWSLGLYEIYTWRKRAEAAVSEII
jgi:hypothetical protein